MNWRIKKAAVAIIFSSLFFASCDDDPTSIGLDLQEPGSQIGTSFTDTTSVEASTVLLSDSIITLSSAQVQAGRVTDGALGTTTAITFAELALPYNNVTFDANKGADSMMLQLDYTYYYGDTTKAVTWNVYRLTEGFIDQTTYYTSRELPYGSTPIGSVTFRPRPASKVQNISGTDTTYTAMMLNIPLDQAVANEFLAQSGQASFASQSNFVQFFKGIAIVPAEGSEGSVLGISPAASSLKLYYTLTSDNSQRTATFSFSGRHFNQIKGDRAGTALAALTAHGSAVPATATQGLTYLQAGTGLATKLTFPNLAKLRSDGNNTLLVNKAELLIPVQPGSYNSQFRLPTIISVVEAKGNLLAKTAGVPNAILQELSTSPATLVFDSTRSSYTVNVTSYVLNLLYGRRENTGLILLPSNISSDLATPTNNAQQVNRAILNAEPDPSGSQGRRPRLRIYYSRPK